MPNVKRHCVPQVPTASNARCKWSALFAKITTSSAYIRIVTRGAWPSLLNATPGQAARTAAARPLKRMLNNKGPRTLPCRTPALSVQGEDAEPFTTARAVVSVRRSAITAHVPPATPISASLSKTASLHAMSNAFRTSTNAQKVRRPRRTVRVSANVYTCSSAPNRKPA